MLTRICLVQFEETPVFLSFAGRQVVLTHRVRLGVSKTSTRRSYKKLIFVPHVRIIATDAMIQHSITCM